MSSRYQASSVSGFATAANSSKALCRLFAFRKRQSTYDLKGKRDLQTKVIQYPFHFPLTALRKEKETHMAALGAELTVQNKGLPLTLNA